MFFNDLVIKRIQGEDGLRRCLAHLLHISQSGPVEHLLGIGFSICKSAAAVTGTNQVAVGIRDGQALGTHNDSLVEQTTGQRALAERAHTAATSTLSEDGHIIGIATKLRDVLLNPLQGLNLVEDAVVARYMMRTLG